MSPVTQVAPQEYDCLVLSGGGAKGAYGAGAAKAIMTYRAHKGLTNPICYIGTSAGALNAFILASKGPDDLIKFWLEASNRQILGAKDPWMGMRASWQGFLGMFNSATPRSFFGDRGLAALIKEHAKLEALHSPLVIAVTDYTRGSARAFYSSDLIERFVAVDAQAEARKRRLGHFRRITDTAMLVKVLLASAAIPLFFPPVRMTAEHDGESEEGWFIDGGVGNNTPTREAAYFFRYLEKTNQGTARAAYCVKQDKPRMVTDNPEPMTLLDMLKRTLDVYAYIHMHPILDAWNRINREVLQQRTAVTNATTWVRTLGVDPAIEQQIVDRIEQDFGSAGGQTRRLDVPLLEIEPSTSLGDSLDFDPERARQEIERGYIDTLSLLRRYVDPRVSHGQPAIDEAEYKYLIDRPIFPNPAATKPGKSEKSQK